MTKTNDISNESLDSHQDYDVSKKETHKKNSSTEHFDKFSKKKNKLKTEVGGPSGPEPTRFGDWERRGRCIDF